MTEDGNERCYICGRSKIGEWHHLKPRSAGGEDGPVIWLCNDDHGLVHKQALNILSKKETRPLFPDDQQERAMKVVRFIVVSIRQERESPDFSNPYVMHIKTTKGTAYLLHILKAEAGYTNLHTFILALFAQVIRSRFGTVRTNREQKRKS